MTVGHSAEIEMYITEIPSQLKIHALAEGRVEFHAGQCVELVVVVDGEEERQTVEVIEMRVKGEK